MENQKELLAEIIRQQKKNYIRLVEIERLTKELGDALSRGDNEAAQLLLGMRKDEMDKADEGKRGMYAILDSLNPGDREQVRALLGGRSINAQKDEETEQVIQLSVQMKRILERTVEIDKVISRKLAGEDSYYRSK